MTGLNVLDAAAKFIGNATKDIILTSRERGADNKHITRPAHIYKMRLPDKEAETKQVPYILLQLVKGDDDDKTNKAQIRVVIATFSDKAPEGATNVAVIITRIQTELRKAGFLENKYGVEKIEYLIYGDELAPYYMGEMMITFDLPTIHREVF